MSAPEQLHIKPWGTGLKPANEELKAPKAEINTTANGQLIVDHCHEYFPTAEKVFIFATGSLRKALLLYWQLVAKELSISLVEALVFAPQIIIGQTQFDAAKAQQIFKTNGSLALQTYIKNNIRNGDGKLDGPVYLGEVNQHPVYVMPTTGETTDNNAAVQLLNKAKAARQAINSINQAASQFEIIAADTVSRVTIGDRLSPPVGKPINEAVWQQVVQQIDARTDTTNNNSGQRKEKSLLLAERLYQVWYLVRYYINDNIQAFDQFYWQFQNQSQDKVVSQLKSWIRERLDRIVNETELILTHINALTFLGCCCYFTFRNGKFNRGKL